MEWLDGLGPWGTGIKAILGVAVGVFGIITSLKSIAIIQPQHTGIKERNGRPVRQRKGYTHLPRQERPVMTYNGFNLLWPWIDTMREIDNREQIREPEMIERSISRFTTRQAKVTFTFRVKECYKFLYVHADPLAEIENKLITRLGELLEDPSWELNEHTTCDLSTFLNDFALKKYGVEVCNVMAIMSKFDGSMAQADAINNVAIALSRTSQSPTKNKSSGELVRDASLFDRACMALVA